MVAVGGYVDRQRMSGISITLLAALAMTGPAFAQVQLQPRMGDPFPGLTVDQQNRFEIGRVQFMRNITVEEGLGPVFNQTSCGSCHNAPLGGPGAQQVTRFGRIDKKGGFDPLADFGGSLLNVNAINDDCLDAIPAHANVTSLRVTPGALAYGLVEAVPDDVFVLLAASQPAPQRGVVRWTEAFENPGVARVGRFGWKAQLPSVLSFSADASMQELGFTNRLLPDENPPRGDEDLLAECDMVLDPEDGPDAEGYDFIDRVTDFQRFLAPPPQTPRSGMGGEAIFGAVGCNSCHPSTMSTSDDPMLEDVLRSQTIHPYGDFLLHDMGAAADGIGDGPAGVRDIRTPPLWGVRIRNPMWHDGSVNGGTFESRVRAAIDLHGAALSQGQASSAAFDAISAEDQSALVAFLDSLGRVECDGDGDGDVDLGDFWSPVGFIACMDSAVTPDDACAVHDVDADGDVDLDDAALFATAFDGGPRDCDDNGVQDFVQIAADPSIDSDQNGQIDTCDPCPADVDGSGAVGADDLLAVLSAWGACASGCDEDINGDLFVGVDDLLAVVSGWGACQ
jgi:CxxC motif-containing protein (DUF1111 family)